MKLNSPLKLPNLSFDVVQRYKNRKIKRTAPKSVVAIDIGTFALKLVEMQLGSQKEVRKIIYYPWQQPAPGRDVSSLIQHPDFAKQLEYLLKTNNIDCHNFYIAAASNKIVMRPFKFPPNIPDYEISQLLALQIGEQIPYSTNAVYYDYNIAKRTAEETLVHVYASEKAYIDTLIDVFQTLKKNIYCINVAPAILWSAVANNYQFNLLHNELLVIINLGASTTEVCVFCDTELLLFRTIPMGGNDFTNAFMQDGSLEFDMAEHTKCKTGLNIAVQMNTVLGVQNELFDQIWRSIQYIVSRNHQYSIRKILLSGGSSLLKGLDSKLRRYIEVQMQYPGSSSIFDVQKLNPFSGVSLQKDIDINSFNDLVITFGTAIGLACGGV